MKRLISLLALAALIGMVLAAPLTVLAQDGGHGEDDTGSEGGDAAVLRGAAVYAEFCQACHGPHGEARGSGPAFPAITFDAETAHEVIADGVTLDDAAMPAYGDVLSEAQTGNLLAYMETWETGDTPPLPEPNITLHVERVPDYFGDAHEGAVVYAKFCAGCHGAEGQGRGAAQFPKLEFDPATTRTIAAEGTERVTMPAFSAEAGGPLSETQLDDLETYLASWALDTEEEDTETDSGIAVMIVVTGIVALATVGVLYIAREIPANRKGDVDTDITPDLHKDK